MPGEPAATNGVILTGQSYVTHDKYVCTDRAGTSMSDPDSEQESR